jgi:hypothetical protein
LGRNEAIVPGAGGWTVANPRLTARRLVSLTAVELSACPAVDRLLTPERDIRPILYWMPTPGPRYTDEQMALILKRAAELQSAGEEQIHTLAEIQQIAQQVGIEPIEHGPSASPGE